MHNVEEINILGMERYTINPVTKRQIVVNGKTFQRLLTQGYSFDGTTMCLYQVLKLPETAMNQVMRLPELLLQIFTHLDGKDLRAMRQVSKLYASIAMETRINQIIQMSPNLKVNLHDSVSRNEIVKFLLERNSIGMLRDFIIAIPTIERRLFCDAIMWTSMLPTHQDHNIIDIFQTISPYIDTRTLNYIVSDRIKSPDLIRLLVDRGISLIIAINWAVSNQNCPNEFLIELLQKGSYLLPGVPLVSPSGELLVSREELKRRIHEKWPSINS